MSLVSLIKGRRGANGFGYASTAEEVSEGVDLSGKSFLITGVNSGLGQETARVLSLRGARVVAAARTEAKAADACEGFADAVPVACELGDPDSVRGAIEKVKGLGALDGLIANAGIMALPERELLHGQEKQFYVNHVGHFQLVTGLLDSLAPGARVVMLSSSAHTMAPDEGIRFDDLSFESGYKGWTAYGQSKLANLLFAKELSRRLEGTDQVANACHPGVIATNLGRHMPWIARALFPVAAAIAMKSIPQGAATQTYLATHPDAATVSGEYYADCNPAKHSRQARDVDMAKKLWDVTEEILEAL